MSQKKGPCRLVLTAKGCHFGNRCKYSHDRIPSSSSRGSTSPMTSPSRTRTQTPVPNSPRSPNQNQGPPNGVPRNVCQFFWTSGACVRGFECSYRHVQKTGTAVQADRDAASDEGEDAAVNFFSPGGLAASAGSVREERHNLNPSEVHNYLKEFLRDNYRFDYAAQVQGFVRVLASVNDRNKTWNTDNAQEFLEAVVRGNALHRIGEVLRFEAVDTTIGSQDGALSFQRGYFPILQFISSDLVLKSTLNKNINTLYAIIKNNHEHVFATLRICLTNMVKSKSWKDRTPNLSASLQNTLDGVTVFRTLSTVFLQYFNRYKDAIRSNADLPTFINDFTDWFETWSAAVSASPSRFEDPISSAPSNNKRLMLSHIREDIERLGQIVERESGVVMRLKQGPPKSTITPEQRSQARIAQLAQTYDPPGQLRIYGPRHDNDFQEIEKVRIAPTHDELFCPVAPYMPVFSPEAPHHLPLGSMERHLDIQFRLLREELISTTRQSLVVIQDDLNRALGHNRQQNERTKLESLLASKGGVYRTSGRDSVFFQVYTNVEFLAKPPEAKRKGVQVTLVVDTPPGGAARDKDTKKRVVYWEHSRRLQGASLVALIVVARGNVRSYLGTVQSYGKDIAESAKHERERIQVHISFFDTAVELMALRGERFCVNNSTFAVLVDNSVMFESVRPFLHKLQTVEPTDIPFMRYIAAAGPLNGVNVLPPKYAFAPGFKYKLQCLAKKGMTISDLDVSNPLSIERARRELKTLSVLDPSQAEAVVDTLIREVSLMQGPPGTGKSFTAKEILRVLFASKIRPIVLIAFTNHALDHMLTSVLDAKITNKIVRLGTRSSDERISQYTLDKLERVATAPTLNRNIKRQYAIMKELEERMTTTMTSIRLPLLTWEKIEEYLDIQCPQHADAIRMPPFWISELASLMWKEQDEEGEFQEVKKKGKKKMVDTSVSRTVYGFWREGQDLKYIQQKPVPMPTTKGKQRALSDEEEAAAQSFLTNPAVFFQTLGFGGLVPPVPSLNRPLSMLFNSANVWSMSMAERTRLADEWERKIRALAYDTRLDEYSRLKEQYKEACKEHDDMKDEIRRRILSESDLIGCTTTGAASLTSLLSSIAPRVLVVEEAGQVLEAHILASLVPSVRHLICIGDPKQLRPNLATYTLSMDSTIGNELFKFDRSLMERLSDNGYPMSQINVQRRMRPTISHFIREILYPKLEDNDIVTRYPSVQGMQKDVFFFNHMNKENGTEDSVSKFNTFEVDMIRDLVLYFLRQGNYSGPGDIAVLCAYLGQLQKVRAALRDLKIAVAVDERDAEQLARQGLDEEIEFEEVLVTKHVRLGTVDIFQGQEAKIVIVSLVRNSGQIDIGRSSIGFLKSANRINVALSRAKHGLYVFGNAANLRQNETWSTILDEMESRDQIGPALPIVCLRHPDQVNLISKPGEIPLRAPAGGCTLPCEARLPCGHACPSACHTALDNHRSTKCMEPCSRTPCPRKHPCSRRCFEDCGKCEFPIYEVVLPCGHTASRVPCYMLEDLHRFKCHAQVQRELPTCEHSAKMACHQDPAKVSCQEPCAGTLSCCNKTCKARCSGCRSLTVQQNTNTRTVPGRVARTRHMKHPCERLLYCEHQCSLDCHTKDQNCNSSCSAQCRQQCSHHKCPKACSEPCEPCMKPCTWTCPHMSCPVLCGSICSRLPCDKPCSKKLKCGHPCPSVCGEPCGTQICITCLPENRKADIVDFIMQRRLEDIDLSSTDVSDRLITLACRHIFTVETLDGHCDMGAFYEIDPNSGAFLSTKSPPINYQKPPTCPTCRGPITALRYGRVTKRATLDILEQNVAGTMSRDLEECSPAISAFTSKMSDHQSQARKLVVAIDDSQSSVKVDKDSFAQANGPLHANTFDLEGMRKVHGVVSQEAQSWYKIIEPVVAAYRRIWKIATTRGAHVKAYEAARTTLYRLEMQEIAQDPARATEAPEPLALVIVDCKIGQPPPKADVRFQIEAYFLTLEIRALIAQLAQARLEELPLVATSANPGALEHRAIWTDFIMFLYKSCVVDSDKAISLAKESSASRQVARASVQKLRFEFEQFRWRTLCERVELLGRAREAIDEERKGLAKKVTNYKYLILQSSDVIQKTYLRQLPSSMTLEDLKEERAWLDDNCRKKVMTWARDCESLEKYILKDGSYQPLSTQELEDIVRSFNFSHRGHFYNCQNGHTFVITECGGAMEAARCPECKAPIGGMGHQLDTTNTRNKDLEAIAKRQGVRDGVYSWNRDE